MADLVYEPGVDDRIRGVGIGEHDEEADERGHEHQRSRREQERPGLAIGARQGLDVEAADSVPVVATEVDETLRSRSLIVSYLTMWTSRFRTPTSSLPPLNGCRSTTRSPASAPVRSRRSSTC